MEFLGFSGITFPWRPEKEKSDVFATWKTQSFTLSFLNESSTGIQKGFRWQTHPVMAEAKNALVHKQTQHNEKKLEEVHRFRVDKQWNQTQRNKTS